MAREWVILNSETRRKIEAFRLSNPSDEQIEEFLDSIVYKPTDDEKKALSAYIELIENKPKDEV